MPENELLKEWNALLADLKQAKSLSIPRCYSNRQEESLCTYRLCGFCDASVRAYAAVVYLTVEADTHTEVKFLAAKTRVAPLQIQTIPRLELLSALLLARLITTVMKALSPTIPQLAIQKCYTDSLVSLFWIRGTEKEWRQFVNNRVREIRELVSPDLWNHCPGTSNPADLPSGGMSVLELSVNQLWRHGPDWLRVGLEPSNDDKTMPTECTSELKTRTHNLIAVETNIGIELIMDVSKYSSLARLLRITATVLRAVRMFKSRRSETENVDLKNYQTEAERLWVESAQRELTNMKILTHQLNLFKDEHGIWRCAGRLTNAELPEATKNPILLPKNHAFTTLIILAAHKRVLHNGVSETLTETRAKYWIPRGRSTVKRTIRGCVICKRFEGLPFRTPTPPPLPKCRVKEAPAFSYTGVDFAGPIVVRVTHSQSTAKVWIALFTCYVTRAIHLDTVSAQLHQPFCVVLRDLLLEEDCQNNSFQTMGRLLKQRRSTWKQWLRMRQ